MESKLVRSGVLLAWAVSAVGCGDISFSLDQVRGSGVAANEQRKVSGEFSRIRDEGSANVNIQVGPAASIKIEGDDNIVPLVKTVVEDHTLVIKMKKSVNAKSKLLVTVTVPQLTDVQLDGAGNINVKGVKADAFTIGMNGAGNISASGQAKSLSASLDGAGNLKLGDLQVHQATASVDGAGNADLWVTDALTASINGVGNIRYKGHPQVTKTVDGVGRVGPS